MAVELETPDNRLLVCKQSQQAGSLLYILFLQTQKSPRRPAKQQREQRKDRRTNVGALAAAADRREAARHVQEPGSVKNKEYA